MRAANRSFGLCLLLAAAVGAAGCDNQSPPSDPATAGCDPLMGAGAPCALPWPSNLYLSPDAARTTGYTLRFAPNALPSSDRLGQRISPAAYTRLDGYSVGTPAIVYFPNLDLTAMATEDHIERSMAADAQVLWFEVNGSTLSRVPYWVERDLHAADRPDRQVLFVRPARILKEATRYIVAFRGLRDQAGAAIPPSPAFRRLVQGDTANDPALAPRQARFDQMFSLLEAQGVPRDSLTLAWDFNTNSNGALHGDLLKMRDDALRRVGPTGPKLKVTSVKTYTPTEDANVAFDLEGTFEVPSYVEPVTISGLPLWQLHRDQSGQVAAQGTRTPRFYVRVPRSAVAGPPHGLVQYGHGLLGSGDQTLSGFNGKIGNTHGLIFYGADLTGMAEDDGVSVAGILQELSRFSSLTDRLHQGLTEWVVLARAMKNQLGDLDELKSRAVRTSPDELFYSGISQGGIFGGSFVALSPDVNRGHLGVPGSNYSTLLHRSTDFTMFLDLLSGFYTDPVDQALALTTIQLLWDATDPVTHYRHIVKEPYPGNSPKSVLLGPAKGDYQVAVVTNEVLARSDLGFSIMANYDSQRAPYGVTPQAYGYAGSGIVLWDFGNAWPNPGNLPPQKDVNGDPHEKPRRTDIHNQQMVTFLRTGKIIDVCNGKGCRLSCDPPTSRDNCRLKP